jgi:hypothetical protein
MLKRAGIGVWVGLLLYCGQAIELGAGECRVVTASSQGLFKIHLSAECTKSERESHAIDAAVLLEALKGGRAIDLNGVVIRGNLTFDALPVSSNPPVIEGVIGRDDHEIRVITAPVSILNSVVQGTIIHRSSEGALVFGGPVTFAETIFEHTVDLSRSVFTQPVTVSGAIFLRESYFVQVHFLGAVNGEKTAFGPHTRFHRSQFHDMVTLQQSGFSGLAEWRIFLKLCSMEMRFSRLHDSTVMPFSGAPRFTRRRTSMTRRSMLEKIFPKLFLKRGRDLRG